MRPAAAAQSRRIEVGDGSAGKRKGRLLPDDFSFRAPVGGDRRTSTGNQRRGASRTIPGQGVAVPHKRKTRKGLAGVAGVPGSGPKSITRRTAARNASARPL